MNRSLTDNASTGDGADLHAYHAAFDELGLDWHWNSAPAQALTGPGRLRDWLQREAPHLLRAYDADFLVDAIESARQRRMAARAAPA